MSKTLSQITTALEADKTAIRQAILSGGGTCPVGNGFDDFASDIGTIPNKYTQADEGKVVSNGALVSQTSTTKTANGTYNTTTNNSVTVNVPPSVNYSFGSNTVRCKPCVKYITVPRIWTTVSITGISYSSFYSDYVWTDGDNIYYSEGYSHYVFDKSTLTWTSKSWSGLSSFYGSYIWTDGIDIYYSTSSGHYVLNKSTSTWSRKNWNGIPLYSGTPNFKGNNVWTDDTNIYMSNGAYQYKLSKGTENWTQTSWTMPVEGSRIWTNGEYIYGVSGNGYYYIYNKSGSQIGNMRYSGISDLSAAGVWSDGNSIYFSSGSLYILSFDGPYPRFIEATAISYSSGFVPNNIWSDGENIYSGVSYKLKAYTTEIISVSSNTHAPSART